MAVDAEEADALYRLLEKRIVPEFYQRGDDGTPSRCVHRIRESMARLTPEFSANRAVRNYTEMFYLPVAVAYADRSAMSGHVAGELVRWRDKLQKQWEQLSFGQVCTTTIDGESHVLVQVFLGEMAAEMISVELYGESQTTAPPFRTIMTRQSDLPGSNGSSCYRAVVPSGRSAADFNPAYHAGASRHSAPLEIGNILWHH